jgi:hypothetical protein
MVNAKRAKCDLDGNADSAGEGSGNGLGVHRARWFRFSSFGVPARLLPKISTACSFQTDCYALTMSKAKMPATGEGYLGEVMVHRISRVVGVVDSVIEAKAGWPPQITLKLKDGSTKKGKLSDFREPTAAERESIPSA